MLSPLVAGEVLVLQLRFVLTNGNPLSVADATSFGLAHSPASGEVGTPFWGTGTFAPDDPANGRMLYTTAAVDTASLSGDWLLQPVAFFAAGPRYGRPLRIRIEAPLVAGHP